MLGVGVDVPAYHRVVEHIRVYLCGSNRRQRRSFGEHSVLKRLSMAHFFLRKCPLAESGIWSVFKLTILRLVMRRIVNAAMGHFSQQKCAIDRRLSTECSLKLRLWRLFDPHEYTRICSKTTHRLDRSKQSCSNHRIQVTLSHRLIVSLPTSHVLTLGHVQVFYAEWPQGYVGVA